MFAFTAAMEDNRFPSAASGLTIGLTVTVCILMGGVWTGSSMNPARSLATALFAYRVEPKALSQGSASNDEHQRCAPKHCLPFL
jgi:glycerol uptake facilitator protein/aquaporin Z